MEKARRAKRHLVIWDRSGRAAAYFKGMEVEFDFKKSYEDLVINQTKTVEDMAKEFRNGLWKAMNGNDRRSAYCFNMGKEQV